MKGKACFFFIILFIILLFQTICWPKAFAKSETSEDSNLEQLMESVEKEWHKLDDLAPKFSFTKTVKTLLLGDTTTSFATLPKELFHTVKEQLLSQKESLLKLFLLGIISAFFADFSSSILKNYVGETGYFAVYAIMLTILLVSYQSIFNVAKETVTAIIAGMKVIVPVYTGALLISGNTKTAVGTYGLVLGGTGAVQWGIKNFIFPVTYLYFLLQMLNYCMKEDRFSKLAAFLKNIAVWVMRFLFGIITGMQVVQCLILPASDQARNSNFSRSLAAIPGLGASARALTGTMMNSAVAVKNAVGVAGMLLLLVIVAVPCIKILVFILAYQLLSALLQPIAAKGVSGLLYATAKSGRLLFQGVVTSVALFLISIAIVTAATTSGGV